MICNRPLYALDLGVKENGARNIKLLPRRYDLYSYKALSERYGSSTLLSLPCGSCLACRINHAKEWAVRCVLESLYHDENWFITLTYDDAHLPENGYLQRKHVREFQKKIWKKFPGVRFFGCGEYGSKSARCHYHMIIFGLHLDDLKRVGSSGLLESPTISKMWPYGFNYIGEVNYCTCNYVAQYVNKKAFGDLKHNVPKEYREFTFCSTRPGIGYQWCKDHLPRVLEYDAVFGPFGSSKSAAIPRYFQKMADELDSAKWLNLKEARVNKGLQLRLNEVLVRACENVEDIYQVKEQLLAADYKQHKRGARL